MKERERISNLEELMAENLMRLDKLENGQAELKFGQNVLLQSMTDLTKVVRKNSTDIEVLKSDVTILKEDVKILKEDVTILKEDVAYLKENMTTKQMFASLLEAVVNGFARNDRQFASMHEEMYVLRQDVDILKAR